MYKTLEIAFYETRMSSRGWRFWLLLGLIGGISFFARQDYLYYAKMGFFLHTGYSFQHPRFLVDDCHPEYWHFRYCPGY